MRPTKQVNQVACHSFCSCFVTCFIVINVAVTFDPNDPNRNLLLFPQSEAVVCRSFLDSRFKEYVACRPLLYTDGQHI